jgi:hypothetical protein
MAVGDADCRAIERIKEFQKSVCVRLRKLTNYRKTFPTGGDDRGGSDIIMRVAT